MFINYCSSRFLFPSLGILLNDAKQQGWTNITDFDLQINDIPSEQTRLRVPLARVQSKPLSIFLRLFGEELRDFILANCNAKLNAMAKGSRGPGKSINMGDVMRTIAFLIHMCSSKSKNFKLEMKKLPEIVSVSVYQRIRPLLKFNQEVLLDLLNKSLSENIQVSYCCFQLSYFLLL